MARLTDEDTESSVDPVTNEPTFYWVSRDSDAETGELSDRCHLWYVKPMRRVIGDRGVWWNTLDVSPDETQMIGFQGAYTLDAIRKWCGTLPDDDRQLLVVGRR